METKNEVVQLNNDVRVLRFAAVSQMVGLSRTTIWRLERSGKFPRRRLIGIRAIGWAVADVRKWIDSREEGQLTDNRGGEK